VVEGVNTGNTEFSKNKKEKGRHKVNALCGHYDVGRYEFVDQSNGRPLAWQVFFSGLALMMN
jgi:hypothetical protein